MNLKIECLYIGISLMYSRDNSKLMYIYRSVQVDELQEQHEELERRYRSTEDEVSCMWCPRCGVCVFLVSMWWY